ncbi:MAG TPA: pilus assembly protein TadG-related protein [Microthrixaceae bacterium]|nr:pilus assembly protein TadG-related protein [Microthrixaceae bacterium]
MLPTVERGSTLLLFPAGILVVMLLSAIAVDLTVVHTARRELQRAVNAATDDAAALLDLDRLYSDGAIAIDLADARRSVEADLAALPGIRVVSTSVVAGPEADRIEVRVVGEVDHIFGRALPGVPATERVVASVAAVLKVRPVDL